MSLIEKLEGLKQCLIVAVLSEDIETALIKAELKKLIKTQ